MMFRTYDRFTRAVRSWLGSERRADQARAERHLYRAFQLLDAPTPGPELLGATLERLGFAYRPGGAKAPGGAYKLLVSACLTAAGIALVVVPSMIAPLIAGLRPALVVQWWTSVLVGLSQRLASGFAVWKVLGEVGEMVASALASPTAVAALTVALAISLVTFRVLTGLVSFERGTRNA